MLSNLNSNFALTVDYLNPALNNRAQKVIGLTPIGRTHMFSSKLPVSLTD